MALENSSRQGLVRDKSVRKIGAVLEFAALALFAILFVVWSRGFITASSFRTIDGRRSYSLSDDAMISMRYAWNFSHGNGLVWNRGEYVQGYTNLLMVLVMSVATYTLSKTTAVLAVQVMGIAFMLATAWLASRIAGLVFRDMDWGMQRVARVVSFAGALAYYPLVYWSLMGMETGLLTALLLAGLLSLLRYERSGKRSTLLLAACFFGLMFLTRNDSILFFVLAWAYWAWQAKEPESKIRMWHVLSAGGFVLFVVLAESAFQYSYYGEILPNTFALKLVGMPLPLRIRNGIGFVLPFLRETSILLALGLVGLLRRYKREKLLLLSMVIAAFLYQVYIGGDVWDYWRIMSPAVPLLLLLDIAALMGLADDFMGERASGMISPGAGGRQRQAWLVGAAMVALASGILWANARFLPEISFAAPPYQVNDNRDNVNAAVALNHVLRVDATVGVTWAGALPYYTDFKAIDFLGKEDRYIAHLQPDLSGSIHWYGMSSVPGHNKYDLEYSIVTLKPTYVERLSWGRQDVSEWAKDHYVEVEYKKHTFLLLKDSPQVLWDKLHLTASGTRLTP